MISHTPILYWIFSFIQQSCTLLSLRPRPWSYTCMLIQLLLELLLLDPQLILSYPQLVAHDSRLHGSQIQKLVLLVLVDFFEDFFLSLVTAGKDTDDGFEGNTYLEELGCDPTCHLGDVKLGKSYFISSSFSSVPHCHVGPET